MWLVLNPSMHTTSAKQFNTAISTGKDGEHESFQGFFLNLLQIELNRNPR